MRSAVMTCVLLVAAQSWAQEMTQERALKIFAACETQRAKALAALPAARGKVIAKRPKDMVKQLEDLKELEETLNAPDFLMFPEMHFDSMTVGDVGLLANGGSVGVLQVIDKANFISKFGNMRFWFEAVDTSEAVDGARVTLSAVYEVTGTRQYKTVAGSTSTVLVLRPFDGTALRPFLKDRPESKVKKPTKK